MVFVSGNIAQDPQPMVCTFQNGNAAIAATQAAFNTAALNTAAPVTVVNAAATVTATATVTLTQGSQSIRTIINTMWAQSTPTATVIIKKDQLSSIAKTGVGVGIAAAAVMALFFLGGCIRMACWNTGPVIARFRSRREAAQKARKWPNGGVVWSDSVSGQEPKDKSTVARVESAETVEGRMVWV